MLSVSVLFDAAQLLDGSRCGVVVAHLNQSLHDLMMVNFWNMYSASDYAVVLHQPDWQGRHLARVVCYACRARG